MKLKKLTALFLAAAMAAVTVLAIWGAGVSVQAQREAELAERDALRREYIDSVKASLTGHLERTYIVEPDGSRHRLPKKK